MALAIASVPILVGEASDRFDLMMEESEKRCGSIDFPNKLNRPEASSSKPILEGRFKVGEQMRKKSNFSASC